MTAPFVFLSLSSLIIATAVFPYQRMPLLLVSLTAAILAALL